MYHKKEELATLLFEGLDNYILADDDNPAGVSINKLLNHNQKYHLIMQILRILPKTNHEKVQEFVETFNVEKETTYDVFEMKQKLLSFRLLLEEVLELGYAFGINTGEIYSNFVSINEKVRQAGVEPSIVAVLDALTDISYVNNHALILANLSEISWEAMENVHDSNMSKILPRETTEDQLKEIVHEFNATGIKVWTERLANGSMVIRDRETNKVMKPSTYTPATLENLVKSKLKIE